MQNVVVYAPSAVTRKVYHRALLQRDLEVYRAKDVAEMLLIVTTFDIDTIIIVDEGQLYELEIALAIVRKRFDHKRLILISPLLRPPGYERFLSNQEFFDTL